jgi:hypothetical protein
MPHLWKDRSEEKGVPSSELTMVVIVVSGKMAGPQANCFLSK